MTDSFDFNHLDEVASAYVDGEATDEERARVEGDPGLLTRVAELRAIADAGQTPVTGPPDSQAIRRAHIDSAMATFDDATIDVTEAAPVIDLRQERQTRTAMPQWLGAAAAVIAVVGGIGFVATQLGGSSDFDAATDAGSAEDSQASPSNGGATTTFAANSEPTAEAMADDALEAEAPEAGSDADFDAGAESDEAASDLSDDQAAEESEPFAPLRIATGVTIEGLLGETEELGPGFPIEEATCSLSSSELAAKSAIPERFGIDAEIGWFPVQTDEDGGELFVFTNPDGSRDGIVLGPDCAVLLE